MADLVDWYGRYGRYGSQVLSYRPYRPTISAISAISPLPDQRTTGQRRGCGEIEKLHFLMYLVMMMKMKIKDLGNWGCLRVTFFDGRITWKMNDDDDDGIKLLSFVEENNQNICYNGL